MFSFEHFVQYEGGRWKIGTIDITSSRGYLRRMFKVAWWFLFVFDVVFYGFWILVFFFLFGKHGTFTILMCLPAFVRALGTLWAINEVKKPFLIDTSFRYIYSKNVDSLDWLRNLGICATYPSLRFQGKFYYYQFFVSLTIVLIFQWVFLFTIGKLWICLFNIVLFVMSTYLNYKFYKVARTNGIRLPVFKAFYENLPHGYVNQNCELYEIRQNMLRQSGNQMV